MTPMSVSMIAYQLARDPVNNQETEESQSLSIRLEPNENLKAVPSLAPRLQDIFNIILRKNHYPKIGETFLSSLLSRRMKELNVKTTTVYPSLV